MAIKDKVSGAWEDISTLNVPVSGAYQEADHANALVNGAWQEVWSAIKFMSLLESTFTSAEVGYATSSGHDHTIWSIMDESNDGGYATYYLEGDFTNPTVSFDWYGFFYYAVSDGSVHYAPAGSISLYTRTTGGTENYPTAVANVGSDEDSDEGTYSTILSGRFDRVGFKVKLRDWGAAEPFYNMSIWNFLIDGKECIPSEDCVN